MCDSLHLPPLFFAMKPTSSPALILFVAVLMVFVLVAPPSDTAITCSSVLSDLWPCVTYLKSGSRMPPAPCCAGAKSLAATATTTPDKQTACGCLKQVAKSANVQAGLAQSLPGNCGISLPYAIPPTVDCTKQATTTPLKEPVRPPKGRGGGGTHN